MSTYIKINMLGQPGAVQYETIPDEDLWEDGEINNQKELMNKIEHHLLITGKWKLIREKE
tara:strand:- start:1454 stop:1633 length:180 start_codon:yes stop_codon:yes gene_type:complete